MKASRPYPLFDQTDLNIEVQCCLRPIRRHRGNMAIHCQSQARTVAERKLCTARELDQLSSKTGVCGSEIHDVVRRGLQS